MSKTGRPIRLCHEALPPPPNWKDKQMTTYLLALYDNEKNDDGKTEAEMAELIGEYQAFEESIKQSGNYLSGEALHPTTTASTVRVREGKRLTTDGPFAKTKENPP